MELRVLSQKNCLVKNLKRFRKQLEREAGKLEATKCAFIPKTFKMPSEYYLLVEEFRKNPGIAWLLKPGCKRVIQQLGQHSAAKRGAGRWKFVDMDSAFIRSLRGVQKVIIGDKHCFELYSYDVLIHQDLRPLTGKEKRIGGFDLIRNDGPVSRGGDLGAPVDGNVMANTHFGCYDDGKKQLKQLFRDLPAQQNV